MKKISLFLSLIVTIVLLVYACSKEKQNSIANSSTGVINSHSSSSNGGKWNPSVMTEDSGGYGDTKFKIRFRHDPIPSDPSKPDPCAGSDCGLCPGFCIIFGWSIFHPNQVDLPPTLNTSEVRNGIGLASVKLVGDYL